MTTRPPLTTRDELQLPQTPAQEKGVLGWVRDFIPSLKSSFRIHAHLFPAVISGELKPNTYKVASLPPAASAGPSAIAFVEDGAVGTKFRGSDGSAWVNLDAAGGGGGGDNISIKGAAVADADFNDTTPAAPGGGVNIKWQRSGSGPDAVSAHVLKSDLVGGANTQVQFNDGGAFGGDAGLVYDKTLDRLTILGGLIVPRLGPASGAASGGAIRIVDGVLFAQTRAGVAAAIADLPASGGKVILTAGTYTGWTGVVLVPDNVEIEGCGYATVIQKNVGSATGLFSNSGANGLGTGTPNSGIAIRHIKIVGEGTAATNYAIRMENTTDFEIEDVWCQDILNGDSAAINIDGCQRFIIRGNRVVNCTNNGIKVRCQAEASTDFAIVDNIVDTTAAQNGIFVANGTAFAASRFAITGNVVRDAGDVGIEIGNTNAPQHADWAVTGNQVYSASGDGILIRCAVDGEVTGNTVTEGGNASSAGGIQVFASAADCTDITIAGNTISGRTAGVGIRTGLASTFRCRRLNIVGNTIRGAAGGTKGIEFAGFGEDSIIAKNILTNIQTVGIDLTGSSASSRPIDRCMVIGNLVNGCGSHGLSASNLTNSKIDGNKFTNNGGWGITISDSPSNNHYYDNDLRGNATGTINGTVASDDLALNLGQADIRGLRETGGPTLLTMGGVADGETLRRVGSTVVGVGAAGDGLATNPYSPGSFTVATEKFAVMSRHLKLTSTQRATLAGTATLRMS